MGIEREAFDKWHYEQYLLENPNIDISNAKYIYNYAHKNALVYQLRESHFTAWQAAKAQAVPEKDAVIKKLSDQLYEQEMKTSAARVLCETACELLDDYAHQDAMVILNDLEQAMKEPK